MADPTRFIDTHHVVIGAVPACPNTAWDNTTYALGDYIHMGKYNHLTIIILTGAMSGATGAVTVKQATSAAGGSAKNVTITERFLCTATAAASDTWTSTAVTSNTWTMPATANLANIVEVDARSLDIANSFEWVAVNITASGDAADRAACLYILSEPRYVRAETKPTAIA